MRFSDDFWRNRKVLVTGHSGFKGHWLASWLSMKGADVLGLSLSGNPPVSLRGISGAVCHEIWEDIREDNWVGAVNEFDPQIVFHLAAQPLVSAGFADPHLTFSTNVIGTSNLLKHLYQLNTERIFLIITTDKVYSPTAPQPFSERSPLGAHDPYAGSKVGAEMVVSSWPQIGNNMATARSGNVVGGGDFASGRLLPDLVRTWISGERLRIRSPQATRPWQHVLEPIHGYMLYAEALCLSAAAVPPSLNFGPGPGQSVSVQSIVDFASQTWPAPVASPAMSDVIEPSAYLESEHLALDSRLASDVLAWRNYLSWQEAITWSLQWYARWNAGEDPQDLVFYQISAYQELLESA